MRAFGRTLAVGAALVWATSAMWGATFGTIVQIGGHVSDIALDDSRTPRLAYIANYTANRIEVLNRDTNQLEIDKRYYVAHQPAAIALSPDSQYLVVVHYTLPSESPGATIINLNDRSMRPVPMNREPLAVAFGNSSRALITTVGGFQWLDPVTGVLQDVPPPVLAPKAWELPVPFANFPPDIMKASAAVSGDGNVIYVLAESDEGPPQRLPGSSRVLISTYNIATDSFLFAGITSTPDLGPRVISVDQDGSNVLAGWGLLTSPSKGSILMAEFPAPAGSYNVGGHAFDHNGRLIYGHIPTTAPPDSGQPGPTEPPVLTVFEADNLTVLERFQLKENLAGKALLSKDGKTLYAASGSGVTVFTKIDSLAQWPRVTASVEDLLFRASGCQSDVLTQQFDIVDPGGGHTDFTLSTQSAGVHLSPTSGTTPARIAVTVDMSVFRNQKGTVAVPITISSNSAINLPPPVRVLVNSREPNQRGTIVNVPGKIVDLLADPVRNRFYVIRQDKDVVLVFDGTSLQQIKKLPTGNTPTQMAMTLDHRFLIVGNDHSQIASVFDLDRLTQDSPIIFPHGHYPRSVAVSNMRILAASRTADTTISAVKIEGGCFPPPPILPGQIDFVDFASRTATTPPTLGIYNNCVPADTVLSATESHSKVLSAMANGYVFLYEASGDAFVASRHDFSSLSGSFNAISDTMLLVDNHLFNSSLVNTGDLDSDGGKSSGSVFMDGRLIRTTAAGYTNPGTMTRVDLGTMKYILPTPMAEAPPTHDDLVSPQDGQIGQMISPFTRTLAALSNRQAFISLSVSGLTVFPWTYDNVLPSPAIQNVVNAADFTTAVAPGGLISVFGNNLADGTAGAGSFPLPTTLAETCLTVNDELVPLLWASSGQINAQLPFDLVGNGTMVLRTAGGISTPYSFQIIATAPAVFQTGVAGPHTSIPTVVRLVNNELVTLSNPVHPKDNLVIYATGLGAVNGSVNAGDAAPFDPLATAATPPTVTLGGMQLPILYAGLVPGFPGLYQINVTVPWNVGEGIQVPLTIEQGGYSTTLSVRVVH